MWKLTLKVKFWHLLTFCHYSNNLYNFASLPWKIYNRYCHTWGGQLDGPNCDKLLRNLDSLKDYVHPKFHNFIEAFRQLKLVKETCFCKSETLDPSWETNIDNYKKAYKALDISVTPKDSLILLIDVHFNPTHQIQQQIQKQ